MPRWNLERKLVVGVLVLFLIPTLLAGAITVGLYRRGVFEDVSALILTAVIGFAAMMGYLGVMTHTIGRSLVRTLLEIQRGTELMATVNPEHRHRIQTGDELESVAEEINRMADRVRDARLGLEAEVARATGDLHAERAKLSAILGELDEGVVVATLEGRVTLVNRAAQQMLGGEPLLGRSLFDFVDRETVMHFHTRLSAGQGAAERFTLHPVGGAVLQAGMTSLVAAEGEATGFILALRDVSRPAREDEARQRLLDDALHDLRGSLSSIRSLSESLLGDPATNAPAGPLLAAIHSEAVRLSELVSVTGGSSRLGLARAPWHFEEVTVADLLAMSLRRFKGQGGDAGAVEVGEVEPGLPSLRAEVSALSVGLAHLLRTVSGYREPAGRMWLAPVRRGGVLQMEAGAEATVAVADLEGSLDTPIALGRERRLTARDIVRRHAGEVWAYADAGRAGFRLTLPMEGDRPTTVVTEEDSIRVTRFMGAGMVSGAGALPPRQERPELYDFSFFDQMERHVLTSDRERQLEELTFVVLDTETTGLRPDDDRIVSLAGVKVRGGSVRPSEFFDALVKAGRPVPAASSRLHGITDAMLADAPPIDVVLPAFERFAEGAVLVGHEIWFDLQFLARAADRIGLPPLTVTHPILDARWLSQTVHGSASGHTLEAAAARLGVVIEGRHSALGDALATAKVFVRLLPLLKKRGIVTLGQALDAARAARGRGPGSRDRG